MSPMVMLLWLPRYRLSGGLLELSRARDDRSHELFGPGTIPTHLAIRRAAIKSVSIHEPFPGFEEAPCVIIATDEVRVTVAFVPYGGGTLSADESDRQRQAGLPACREFYACLVREMAGENG